MSNQNMNVPCSVIHSASIAVGTTAVQLPNNTSAKWVQFMHTEASAQMYIGGKDVTIANGFGALELKDTTERYPIFNLNEFWIVSDTDATIMRYLWGE